MPDTPELWLESQILSQNDPLATGSTVIQLASGEILTLWNDANPFGAGAAPGDDILGRTAGLLGTSFGYPFLANVVYFANNESGPEALAMPDGNYLMTYIESNTLSGHSRVRYVVQNTNTGLVDFEVIDNSSVSGGYVDQSLTSLNTTGTAVFYLEDSTSTGGDFDVVYMRVSTAGMTSFQPRQYMFGNNPTNGDIYSVDSTMRSDGRVLVTADVESADHVHSEIWYEMVTETGAQMGVQRIASTTGDSAFDTDPAIAGLNNQTTVIVWKNVVGSDSNIAFALIGAGGVQAGATRYLGAGTADMLSEPEVIALPTGGFIILYVDGAAGGLMAQRFDNDLNAVGTTVMVSSLPEIWGTQCPGLEGWADRDQLQFRRCGASGHDRHARSAAKRDL